MTRRNLIIELSCLLAMIHILRPPSTYHNTVTARLQPSLFFGSQRKKLCLGSARRERGIGIG
jgi:hypothetical protein